MRARTSVRRHRRSGHRVTTRGSACPTTLESACISPETRRVRWGSSTSFRPTKTTSILASAPRAPAGSTMIVPGPFRCTHHKVGCATRCPSRWMLWSVLIPPQVVFRAHSGSFPSRTPFRSLRCDEALAVPCATRASGSFTTALTCTSGYGARGTLSTTLAKPRRSPVFDHGRDARCTGSRVG